ncbi:hypothetical protein AAFF_G00317140 [Aldrovandia affinis]|uniref:Uncharacterized protein n=1 Tax=Aldrovandia affinis TaxID=143900 RepID=A0AAD7R7S9_9TELE|nr:hypothetical protein AAFF_G00317140 [Aldrovandia affinis]
MGCLAVIGALSEEQTPAGCRREHTFDELLDYLVSGLPEFCAVPLHNTVALQADCPVTALFPAMSASLTGIINGGFDGHLGCVLWMWSAENGLVFTQT